MDLLNGRGRADSSLILPAALLLVLLCAGGAFAVGDTLDVPLFESFEVPFLPSWFMNGQWHINLDPDTVAIIPAIKDSLISLTGTSFWPTAPVGDGYLVMSGESTGTYISPWNPGLQVFGNGGASTAPHSDTVYTPLVRLDITKLSTLTFKTWFEVEGFGFRTTDKMIVEYSNDEGLSFAPLDEMADTLSEATDPAVAYSSGGLNADGVWVEKSYGGLAPSTSLGLIQFRFIFRSGDSFRNGFRGWMIDDLSIRCDSLYPPYDLHSSSDSCGGIHLSWSDSSTAGGISYVLKRFDTVALGLDTISAGAGSAFFDSLAFPGRIYEYRVEGMTVCGSSGPSELDSGSVPVSPMNPGSVQASDSTCAHVQLSWIPVMPEGNYYGVFRNGVMIDTLPPGSFIYDDSTSVAGVKYEYNVAAIGQCDTAWSLADSGFSIDPPPSVPWSLATDDRCSDVKVTWGAPVGSFDYYTVYRESDSLGVVHPDSTREFYDAAIDSMTAYTYTVRTGNACGLSDIISTDTGSRKGLPPSAASCSATDNLCYEVVVSWVPSTAPGVVGGYVVRRDADSLGYVPVDSAAIFRDSSASTDSVHIYSVQSRSACGVSVALCTDTGIVGETPPTPYAVNATDSLCAHVLVEWDSTAGEFLEYVVIRDGDSIGTVAMGDSTYFIDSEIDSIRVSAYWVKTKSACGVSPPGISDTGKRLGLPPAPQACTATDNLCGRVTIAWSDTLVGIVDRYILTRDGVPIDTLESPPFQTTDVNADSNSAHYYEVVSWNGCGRSIGASGDSGTAMTAPGPPTLLTASQEGCGEVTLDWGPPVGGGPVEGYRITRGSPPITTDLGPAVFQYVDVPSDSEVAYTVRAFNCEESTGIVDTGRTVGAIPNPPANCSVEVLDCTTLRINWDASPTATDGYVIMRDGAVRIDSVSTGVLSVTDTPPQAGVDYDYSIFALNSCGGSAEPCSVGGRIPGPIGPPPAGSCSASTDSCNGIHLGWYSPPAGSSDIKWFKIFRLPGGTLLDSLGWSDSTWVDTAIAYGDSATYRLIAGNACYVSAGACTVHGERPPLPSEPENCSASSDRCDRVTLNWTLASSGVEEGVFQFKIYRKLSQTTEPFDLHATVLPSIGVNTWDDTEVEPLRSYFYRIAAVNKCGETAGLCTVQGSIIQPRPGPVLLSPEDDASELDLPLVFSWESVTGVSGYVLQIAEDELFAGIVIDTQVAVESLSVDEIEFDNTYYWKVMSVNECGEGSAAEVRRLDIGVAPGVELIAGSPLLHFGNEADTLFEDSAFVIRNMGKDSLDWLIDPDPDWIAFDPAAGTLPGGDSVSITAGVAAWRCGEGFSDTMTVKIDPPREGREPVTLYALLAPPPRPPGDYNWDCLASIGDAGALLEALLGLVEPAAEESLGADTNGDGRINIADLVLLGSNLAAAEIAASRSGPPVQFALTGDGSATFSVRSDEPLRALRMRAQLEGKGSITPVDPATTIVVRHEDDAVSLFWFTTEASGLPELDLVRVEGEVLAKNGPFAIRPTAIELLGSAGEVWRPVIENAPLIPADIPARLTISAVRPNPFNAYTTIDFALPAEGRVEVDIFDIRGGLVRRVLAETRAAGSHQISWNGETNGGHSAATGVYFVQVKSAGEKITRRMTLLR